MIKTIGLKITGRVQGVGFRWWGKRAALDIGGISGWIRNAEDGSVEILMRGEEASLDEMVLRCRRGPWAARVDKIEFFPGVARGFLPDIEDGKFIIV